MIPTVPFRCRIWLHRWRHHVRFNGSGFPVSYLYCHLCGKEKAS